MTTVRKEELERWLGDQFVDSYNQRHSTRFTFARHGLPPESDLVHVDGASPPFLEVTGG